MNRFEPLDFIVICEHRPRYLRITKKNREMFYRLRNSFKDEVISDVFFEERTASDAPPIHGRRNPKITGSSSVKIQRIGNLESRYRLALE